MEFGKGKILSIFDYHVCLSACIGLPRVIWVLPYSYLDVPNKDYGGGYFLKFEI